MTQISRDSKEITPAVAGPVFLDDSSAGTVSTPGYATQRFQSCLAYIDVADAVGLGIRGTVECSPDGQTFYRASTGIADATAANTQGNHNVGWTGLTGGSSLMMAAAPIGAHTRVSVIWEAGQGDVSIRLGFKS